MLPEHLIFMRHGIAAETPEFDGPDFKRPLTAEGRRRTAEVARVLVDFLQPSVIVSSDLVRAIETAQIVLDHLPGSKSTLPWLRTESLRPDSDFAAWREFLQSELPAVSSRKDVVLVVGHQPTISEIFSQHLGLTQTAVAFKKAGFAILQPIAMQEANLIAFIPPRVARGGS